MFARLNANRHVPAPLRRALRVLAFVLVVVMALALAWIDRGALCALPAIALALLLAARRYPGEHIIAALSGYRGRRKRSCPSAPVAVQRELVAPRGGLLLGRSLAVRPPPRVLPAAS